MVQGSDAGCPSMRHTNPNIDWTIVTSNPVCPRASRPEFGGSGAQRVATPAPKAPKSTITVTPLEVGHGPFVQAIATRGFAVLVPSATASARARAHRAREPVLSRLSSFRGSLPLPRERPGTRRSAR